MASDWKLPLIIGCSVGGFLLILAVFTVIIYFCCRSSQRKKRCYESNLRKGESAVDNGYTTFSLQKPGMPPLPSSGQPHLHGGLWTTQAGAPAQQWTQPIVAAEVKSQSDNKKASASTDVSNKQSKTFWRDSKLHLHSSTDSTESVNDVNGGSYGSQSELILKEQKPEGRNKNVDSKANQRKSEIPEPDMSAIEEELNSNRKVGGHHKVLPSRSEPQEFQHQVAQVRRYHSEDADHRAAAAAAAETDRRRTIYPPPASAPPLHPEPVDVDAVVEIQHKPPVTRTLTNISEDKRLILEAFSFLDEFEG